MEQTNITAFISYSWDSSLHQTWVANLANKLREKDGIDVNIDIFETSTQTVNLNTMMIKNIRDSDFIIIVLTENYVLKADSFQGGVGFETMLSLPILKENPDKLIFLTKEGFNAPFHLKDYYLIDFSDESKFDAKYDELVYRLRKIPLYIKAPLGKLRDLKPKNIMNSPEVNKAEDSNWLDLDLSGTKPITDRDKELFMRESFKEIINSFNQSFERVKVANSNFEFDQEKHNEYKFIYKLYLDGKNVQNLKIWYGNFGGSNTINLSYGQHSMFSDNSLNESINYQIIDNKLKLRMTMNIFSNENPDNPEQIVKEIWKNHIISYLR